MQTKLFNSGNLRDFSKPESNRFTSSDYILCDWDRYFYERNIGNNYTNKFFRGCGYIFIFYPLFFNPCYGLIVGNSSEGIYFS